jgi:hypothetical protein
MGGRGRAGVLYPSVCRSLRLCDFLRATGTIVPTPIVGYTMYRSTS